MFCPKHSYIDLLNNYNTGIEYEYGVGLALMSNTQFNDFFNEVVSSHSKRDVIENVYRISSRTFSNLFQEARIPKDRYVSFASTQNDDLGPSDVLVCNNEEIKFGISVKYANANNWNPSSRNFLKEKDIYELRQQYENIFLHKYIDYMRFRYGSCVTVKGSTNTWSRKKNNLVTEEFIDLIRDRVISNWLEMSNIEKQSVFDKGYQINSPFNYYVSEVTEFKCKLSEPKPFNFDINDIYLVKDGSSCVAFKFSNKTLVKLQVKFNNGFLEKAKVGQNNAFKIDDILFKKGDPFGSWNFNIL